MRKIWNKGHRIRASDKHLVYHFSIGTLLFLFVAVLLLLNIKQLMRTDWEHFSLLENGLTLSPYNFITILIATGVCALVAFLYYRFCYDSFKKLLHRQKLARMILENKWYEADTVQDSGFFTDLQGRSREKIVWFPKIYYQMEKGLLHIRCEITLGKYQDQLSSDMQEEYVSLLTVFENLEALYICRNVITVCIMESFKYNSLQSNST